MAYNYNYIVIIFFLTFLVHPSTCAYVCENFTDCRCLLKFKEGITSDPGGHLQAWNKTNFFCNWTGIKCHSNLHNRVISLELQNMRLQGRITPFISNLSLLTTLSLQENNFFGVVPTSLGELSELSSLNISMNALESNIPISLQGCSNLKMLDMSSNYLTGSIPEGLGRLNNLAHLELSANNLTGVIPSSLSNLTGLTHLALADNYFTGKVPAELGALTKLKILYLHVNYFNGTIPASISNCTALCELSLFGNQLVGDIPSELGAKLRNMQKLYLWDNRLSGEIPVTLGNLSQLTLLDLSMNKLEGVVPSELGMLKNLEILHLHSNDLVSGSRKSSLSFLTALTNCSLLQKLHLASCLFAGSLPASIGGLSKDLYYFNILNNDITGEIPDSIGNLSSLVTLTLWYNNLNGTIPATLAKLGQLQRLNLGRNKLLGPIPDDMGQMTKLGSLDLSKNLLSGSIPSSLGNLSQLRYLYLFRNRLSGNFPTQLNQCSLLMLLDLSFNNLEGSLPTEVGLFRGLSLSFNLSNNNFGGDLPASIGNLASVQEIDLSENMFSGMIPNLIGNCISLAYLNLSHNMLEGIIPESLQRITHLEFFDLAANKLTGNVPIWISDMRSINTLNLSHNKLTGEVPSLGKFKNLGRSSFMGNVGLCGGSESMSLSPCEIEKERRQKRKRRSYVLAISVGCALLLSVLVAVFIRHFLWKRTLESVIPILSDGFRTFTQRELEVGTGGFREANLLGKGRFGSVYKAIIDNGETVVAVKVLNEECRQNYKSLKREYQILLSGIRHRNLIKMIGSAWNSEFKAIVLDFVGNGNLEHHLYPNGSEEGGCQMTLRERMGVAIDVAHGLEYLHEGCSIQVVHCDLKPQNVLLDNAMVARVADFGIGKLILADKPEGYVSTTAFLRGTVGYIAPEYGQTVEVSTKGDVYAFGVMLLEMITGKKPTNEMFSDGLYLRKWVASSSPDRILDVMDNTLKQEAYAMGVSDALERFERGCIDMLDVGMMCTQGDPQTRPLISVAVKKLKDAYKELQVEARSAKNRE